MEVGGRALADQVHRGPGGAHAIGQAGGTADDLDAVVENHVVALSHGFVIAIQALQAIDLIVLHLKPARVNLAGIRTGVATLVDAQTG
ncbi:hypothetical protein D3C72_2101390 [compost metagenome]